LRKYTRIFPHPLNSVFKRVLTFKILFFFWRDTIGQLWICLYCSVRCSISTLYTHYLAQVTQSVYIDRMTSWVMMVRLNCVANTWRWTCCCIIPTSREPRRTTPTSTCTRRGTPSSSSSSSPTTLDRHRTSPTWPTTRPSSSRSVAVGLESRFCTKLLPVPVGTGNSLVQNRLSNSTSSSSHFAPGRVRNIAMSMTVFIVCLSVCVLAYPKNHTTDLHENFCACSLWLWCGIFSCRCDTLCTSGIVDGVKFSRNGLALWCVVYIYKGQKRRFKPNFTQR